MELNMDGWGANEKYPHAFGEPYTSINRWYLKLKSELLPYAYSIAEESVSGLPMIRAMFLEYPNPYTLGKATQYQFLYGPYFLVAPIYQETRADEEGNDVRHGIYLPEGQWIDYFTGDLYEGGKIYNDVDAPLWKLPVFVKNGAIIPMANPSNNVSEINPNLRIYELYPHGSTSFTVYDDDGVTEEYRAGKGVRTLVESRVDDKNNVTVTVHPAVGDFNGFQKKKATEFRINVTQKPSGVSAKIGENSVNLAEANSMEDFKSRENVYFYDRAPNLNRFATKGSDFEKKVISGNPQLLVKLGAADITAAPTVLSVEGFRFEPAEKHRLSSGALTAPANAAVTEENAAAYTLKPTWTPFRMPISMKSNSAECCTPPSKGRNSCLRIWRLRRLIPSRCGPSTRTAIPRGRLSARRRKPTRLSSPFPELRARRASKTRAVPWRSCLTSRKRMPGTRSMARRPCRLTWSWI